MKNIFKATPAWAVIFATLFSFALASQTQLLELAHTAPFPVSKQFDSWLVWLLKLGTFFSGGMALFTKHKDLV